MSTPGVIKDYRTVLFGLLSCVDYGWFICAGRKWYRLPVLTTRVIIHIILWIMYETETRPHCLRGNSDHNSIMRIDGSI